MFVPFEEKELTFSQNQKQQKKFIRFLVDKLHYINSISDELIHNFMQKMDGKIDTSGSLSLNLN